jgi:hypothetical protein
MRNEDSVQSFPQELGAQVNTTTISLGEKGSTIFQRAFRKLIRRKIRQEFKNKFKQIIKEYQDNRKAKMLMGDDA